MEALFETFNPVFEGRSGNWDVDLKNFLECYLQELHNETSCSSMINFSQAAIVLQKSASVYEKKVDYLSQLVLQLLDVLQLSKSSPDKTARRDVEGQSAVVDDAEPSTSRKNQGRKSRSNKPYLLEEFSQINNKVSVKSLDLADVEKTSSKPELTLTRSAVFGRMVNIKKKREHELYIFDKNEECMGKKDDFRLSWSLNQFCVLVEDPFDESVASPPLVSESLHDPLLCHPLLAMPSPVSPSSVAECAGDCLAFNPTLPVDGQGPTSPVDGQGPTSPVDGQGPTSPVDGQGPTLPVDGQGPTSSVDGQGPYPPSSNQQVPSEQDPAQVLNENPSQEVPVEPSLDQEIKESSNQEVPEAQTPCVAMSNEPGTSQGVVLPDTPPDSQVLRDTPGMDFGTARLSIVEENVEEIAAARRNLRDKNIAKDRDNLYALNFLFSASLLETLDDPMDVSSLSMSERVRVQAKKVLSKGKRRFREVSDGEEGLVGFEEIGEEPVAPTEDVAQTTIQVSDLPQDEVPQLTVPVPTPPPTPSNSLPMSPDLVSRTPRSEVHESRCPIACSPMGSPMGEPPEVAYSETPINVNPYASTETDRSARVAAWQKSIKQRLEDSDSRPPFDVHVYGSKVITSFPSVGSTLDFKDLVAGMDKWEISRVFVTSLMLANTQNVEISLTNETRLPVDCLSLRLLSTQRHEEELEAFCAPSVDLQRRSNTETQSAASGLVHRKRKDNYAHSRPIPHKKSRV